MEKLDVQHLMSLHNIDVNQALDLLNFCNKNTIYNKSCYGKGDKMFRLWKNESILFRIKGCEYDTYICSYLGKLRIEVITLYLN